MTEKEIEIAKKKLSCRNHGELRKLFYKKNGLPKQTLLTNRQILEKLKILEKEPNTLEDEGLLRILGVSLAYLRKQAKQANQAWVDLEIGQGNKKSVARHGFSSDIEQIMKNANKYDSIALQRESIAEKTRLIAGQQEKLLTT